MVTYCANIWDVDHELYKMYTFRSMCRNKQSIINNVLHFCRFRQKKGADIEHNKILGQTNQS